jgi:hypothetical protein
VFINFWTYQNYPLQRCTGTYPNKMCIEVFHYQYFTRGRKIRTIAVNSSYSEVSYRKLNLKLLRSNKQDSTINSNYRSLSFGKYIYIYTRRQTKMVKPKVAITYAIWRADGYFPWIIEAVISKSGASKRIWHYCCLINRLQN